MARRRPLYRSVSERFLNLWSRADSWFLIVTDDCTPSYAEKIQAVSMLKQNRLSWPLEHSLRPLGEFDGSGQPGISRVSLERSMAGANYGWVTGVGWVSKTPPAEGGGWRSWEARIFTVSESRCFSRHSPYQPTYWLWAELIETWGRDGARMAHRYLV